MQQSSSNLQQQQQQQPQLASALEQKLSRIIIISNVLMQFVHTHARTHTHTVCHCVRVNGSAGCGRVREGWERGGKGRYMASSNILLWHARGKISVSRAGGEGKGRLGEKRKRASTVQPRRAATTAALFHFSFRYTHCARAPTVHNKYLYRFVKGLRFWGVSVAAAAAGSQSDANRHPYTAAHLHM